MFLHGIASTATTWEDLKRYLIETWGWQFGGHLEIVDFLPDCTLDNPCAGFLGGHGVGDFYTANFQDSNANYANSLGIRQQGREVSAFLERLQDVVFPPNQRFTLVSHSMGGLAARSYMVGLDVIYADNVHQLITYGTPHLGTSLATLLQDNALAAFVNDHFLTDIDSNGDGVRDMVPPKETDPPTTFLKELSAEPLPPGSYVSIVSLVLPPPPRKCTFIDDIVGPGDCIVPVDSQNLKNIDLPNSNIEEQIQVIHVSRLHWEQTRDHSAITCALRQRCLQVFARSPVDLEVTAPDGSQIGKFRNEILGAKYAELPQISGNNVSDAVTIPFAILGEYMIEVIPNEDAEPTDTYTLEMAYDGTTIILAESQEIQASPAEPFSFVGLNIDIKPGSMENPVNASSPGRIPVALLSMPEFDPTVDVDTTSLTFGRTGNERSVAKCSVAEEDLNYDGDQDLICHFYTELARFDEGDTLGILKGNTMSGAPLVGSDTIRIVR